MLQITIPIILLATAINTQQTQERKMCSNSKGSITWKQGCNSCYCEKGIEFCSALECDLPERETASRRCTSGATWKKDCNYCVCKNQIPVCTNAKCPPNSLSGLTGLKEKCLHGSSWKNKCNDCFCFFGLAACTVRLCILGVGLNQNNQCVHGTTWKKGCDRCVCSHGIPVCSIISCHRQTSKVITCVNGASWRQDCNDCTCFDGEPMCTLRNCTTDNNPESISTSRSTMQTEQTTGSVFSSDFDQLSVPSAFSQTEDTSTTAVTDTINPTKFTTTKPTDSFHLTTVVKLVNQTDDQH